MKKKKAKKYAWYAANKLLEGEELNDLELAALYKVHLPKIKKGVQKDTFDWIRLFVAGKKDLREYLKFVFCDGENLVASNGYAIAYTPNIFGLAEGFYGKYREPVVFDYPTTPRGFFNYKDTIQSQCEGGLIEVETDFLWNIPLSQHHDGKVVRKGVIERHFHQPQLRSGIITEEVEELTFSFNEKLLSKALRHPSKIKKAQLSYQLTGKYITAALFTYEDESQMLMMAGR